jgi:mono/diheme cytochrome c family protein
MDQTPHYKDEIDWWDLLRKPEKLFGYSYPYVLAVLLGIGVLYVWNLNTIGKNAVPPGLVQDSVALVKDIPFQSPRIIPPVDIMKVGISSPELITKGHDLFKANCSTCHGDNGQGDGPSAPLLNPTPRNFHSLDGWINGTKVTQMYKTLEEGIRGGGMASYNYMSPEDRFALIHYIRTFVPNQPNDAPDDLKQLDLTYGLAKGMNIPGQIPIKKALGIIEKESVPLASQIHETALQIAASKNMEADILKLVSFDEKKVLTSVARMKSQVKNVDDFIRIISADPIHSGFKAGVVRLSSREWSKLYNYIFSVVKEETGK